MTKKIDWVGRKYKRLTVIEDLGRNPVGSRMLKCLCDCGNVKVVQASNLVSGATTSCGCYNIECSRERATTHGGTHTRLFCIWCNMVKRCINPNDPGYVNYGGRGIKICDEWLNSFEAFRDWALANGYADDLTIERIDVNGGYCPENCCWIPKEKQVFNKTNSIILTINGKTQDLALHVEDPEINILGLSYGIVRSRIRDLGWTPEKAFSTPVGGTRARILTIKGKTQTLTEHIADPEINVHNLNKGVVKTRIYKYKWPAEKALSTPLLPRGKRKN